MRGDNRKKERSEEFAEIQLVHEHLHDVIQKLESFGQKLDVLYAQGRKIIMANAETKAILVKIDEETTAVGERVAALLAQVSTGMSPAEVAEINAQGQAIVARLTDLASNPDNPVPEEPPVA